MAAQAADAVGAIEIHLRYPPLLEDPAGGDGAQRLAREFGWHTIDATGKSVEEIAQEIVTLLPLPADTRPTPDLHQPAAPATSGRPRQTP